MRKPSLKGRRRWWFVVLVAAAAALAWAHTGPAAEPTTAPAGSPPAAPAPPAPSPPPSLLRLPPAAPPAGQSLDSNPSPPGQPAQPASQPAVRPAWGRRVALRPYTAFSWSAVGPMRHVSPLGWVTAESNPAVVARSVSNRAEGCRVLFSWNMTGPLLVQPEDRCRTPDGQPTRQPGIWPGRGVQVVAARLDDWLDRYARAGGQCDLFVLDDERGWSVWAMPPDNIAAVEQDPRFADVRRDLGFGDVARTVTAGFHAQPQAMMRWNAVTNDMLNRAFDQSVGTPLARHFPGAWMSNFGGVVMPPENVVPDLNGVPQYTAGEPCGNCQSPVVYGVIGQIAGRVPGPDWKSPFTVLAWTTNHVRSAARSSPLPVLPWVAFRSWPGDHPESPTVPWVNTDYWRESVYHALLSGGTADVLFWNPMAPARAGQKPPPGSSTYADAELMDAVLADLEQQAGGSPLAKPLTTAAADYKAQVLVSAARTAAGRTVARVTFADGVNAARVEVDGRTYDVSRPAGKVGAWIVPPSE